MKKKRGNLVAALLTLALAGAVSTATGCGGGAISTLCENVCACLPCRGNDPQDCKDNLEKDSDDAATGGCGSEFDDAIACMAASFSCKDGGDVGPFAPGCDDESAALAKCLKK